MPETSKLKLPYPPGSQANDIPSDVKKLADRLEEIEKAKIGWWYMTLAKVAPELHVFMLGQPIQRTQYPDFFDRLGIAGNSYILPNMQRRVPIGALDTTLIGQGVGATNNLITLSAAQNGPHSHNQSAHVHDPGSGSGHQYVITSNQEEQHFLTGLAERPGGPGNTQVTYTDSPSAHPGIGTSGSGDPIDITPYGILTNFVIKVA